MIIVTKSLGLDIIGPWNDNALSHSWSNIKTFISNY